MNRLINADKLKKDILGLKDCYNGFSDAYDKDCIISVIDEQPTIEERKTGKWINANDGKWNTVEVLKCSVCGEMDNRMYRTDKFCTHCGAKMEG